MSVASSVFISVLLSSILLMALYWAMVCCVVLL
jgi:hypothetical protein